jgi:hypothetical protein
MIAPKPAWFSNGRATIQITVIIIVAAAWYFATGTLARTGGEITRYTELAGRGCKGRFTTLPHIAVDTETRGSVDGAGPIATEHGEVWGESLEGSTSSSLGL